MECDSSALATRVGIKPEETSIGEQTVTHVRYYYSSSAVLKFCCILLH